MDNTRVSHYEIRRLLGRGGMGEVYEAFDLNTKRLVALKFIASELAADPDAFRRFEAEAQHAAQLHHPHIATLFGFEPEGDRPFIAMERVAGPNLRERVRAGRLPIPDALAIARDIAAAIDYAHRRGIVHRDIKPENLMFDDEGRIKVMDFGLARALIASRLTITGTTLGTAAYMAPESVAGTAGPPADVFALGLVLHEMLSGEAVFSGDSPLSVMFAIANTDPPPIRTRRPEVPEDVERLITRMLAHDAAQRATAAEAARELARMTGVPVQASEATTEPLPAPTPSGGSTAPAPPKPSPLSRPWVRGAIAAAIALVIAVVVALLRPSGGGTPPAEAVSLNNRAIAALDAGDIAQAQVLATQALALAPDYARARLNLARIYEVKGEIDSATTLYEALLAHPGRDPEIEAMAHYNLGDVNLRSGSVEEAIKHFRASLALDSSAARSYNNYALALIQGHRAPEALALLGRGLARFPSAEPLLKNAALASLELQDTTAARRYLDQAIAANPKYAAALGLRARLRAHGGDRAGALADWRAFANAEPPPLQSEYDDVLRDLVDQGVSAEPKLGHKVDLNTHPRR